MSTPEQNKEIVRRFYAEVMTAGNVDVCDEIVHQDFHDHGETLFGSPEGRQALKDAIVQSHSIFPDLNVTLEDVVAADDYVGVRGEMRTHHTGGEFLGAEATGNEVQWNGIAIFKIRDAKIAERWFNSDGLSIVQQFGVVPPQLHS
jgi:predicted ester cyclase